MLCHTCKSHDTYCILGLALPLFLVFNLLKDIYLPLAIAFCSLYPKFFFLKSWQQLFIDKHEANN